MQNELLERVPTLRDDKQTMRHTAGREDLLDGATAGHELLVGSQQVRRRHRFVGSRPGRWFRPGARPLACPLGLGRAVRRSPRWTIGRRTAAIWRALTGTAL